MNRILCTFVCFGILSSTLLVHAEDSNFSALRQAYKKRREIYTKVNKARGKLAKNPELVKLRTAWQDARKKLEKKLAVELKDERKAEKDAQQALKNAITKRIESSDEIKAVQKKRADAQQHRRTLNFQIAQTELQLYHYDSPLQQELDADPSIKELKQATLKATAKQRSAAWKKLRDVRREKLKTLKNAKKLFAKVAELRAQIKSIDKLASKAWSEVYKVRRDYQLGKKDDAEIKELRKKYSEATKVTRKGYFREAFKEDRLAASKASRAYFKKRRELSQESKELQELEKQLDAINKEIKALNRKKRKKAA